MKATESKKEQKRKKEEKKHKFEKRVKIILTILFVVTLIILLVNNYSPNSFNKQWILLPPILICIWFFVDSKIFFNTKTSFICIILSLLPVWKIDTQDIVFSTFATLPLSVIIVMFLGGRHLCVKLDTMSFDKHIRWRRLIGCIVLLPAFLISTFVFNPILRSFF